MQRRSSVTVLLCLGATACIGLGLLWTQSAGALGGGELACVLATSDELTSVEEVHLAAIPTAHFGPVTRLPSPSETSSTLRSDAPRTLQVSQWHIAGRVVGRDGLPLSGHSIRLGSDVPGAERARSDAEGAFNLSMPARSDVLVAEAPGYVTVAGTRASRGKPGFVVALPARGYAATVGDAATGLPLSAARVTPIPSDALHASLEATRSKLAPEVVFVDGALPSISTDRLGVAVFDALPGPQWIDGIVTRPGYQDQRVSFEATSGDHLAIWLEPIDLAVAWTGQVVDATGEPLSGAWVASGRATVRTGSDGSFALPKGPAGAAHRNLFLDAYHPAHGAARLALVEDSTARIELMLPGAAEPLRLRLLARTGSGEWQPVAGARALPLASEGRADFLGPFWRAGRTGTDGVLELPSAMGGTGMIAYAKGGEALGRFVLAPGDLRLGE